MAYNCRNNLSIPAHPQDVDNKSESSYSGSRGQGSSVEPWEYGASGSGPGIPTEATLGSWILHSCKQHEQLQFGPDL